MNLLVDGINQHTVLRTDRATKLAVDGITSTYPIYQIKLDCLYFNDQNDRISTWIGKYKTEHGEDSMNLDDIEKYNEIIQNFIYKSNPERLEATQKNIEIVGQQKFGVVLTDGRIIDGNRRFCCLRNLAKTDEQFSYFEAVILDKDIEYNAKQIKMLELQIQIGEESKVDYDPIDRLMGIYRDIVKNKLITVSEYARATNKKENEVKKDVEIATLLEEFLESINMPEKFHIARELNLNGPLYELYGTLKKIKDTDAREQMKYIIFNNFLLQPSGDMTRFIRKTKDIVDSEPDVLNSFMEEELEIAEKVFDSLPTQSQMNKSVISQLRSDEVLRKNLANEMDKHWTKANATKTKAQPVLLTEKAGINLENVDINLFSYLTLEQLEEITDNIEKIEELIKKIKGALNV